MHDAEDPGLVPLGDDGAARVHPALLDADLTLVLGAAETIVHGGPGTLVAATDAATVRRVAGADSLLEAAGAPEWDLALGVESALATRVPLVGVSLVLDLPRLTGRFRGYPESPEATDRVASSPLRPLFSRLPGPLRHGLLDRQARRLAATAAFAGLPSIAHAEALVRGAALRGTTLEEPVDALVVGVPWVGAQIPREPVNPLTAAAIALGLALRLRKDAFPIRPGGTLVLVHPFRRSFAHVTQAPYASMFGALRAGGDPTRARGCGAGRGLRQPRRRLLPSGRGVSSAAPVRRLGRMRARALEARTSRRRRHAATRSRPGRSASSRATGSAAPSRWRTASPEDARESGSCSRRPTRRSSSPDVSAP